MMIGFGLLALLVLGGVLFALLGGGAARFSRRTIGWTQPTARQLLDERLARGEIDRQEYDRIRRRIE